MGVLRELAARKERQRAWKKANAHVPPVAPVVAPDFGAVFSDLAGVRSGSMAETPVAQQDSVAARNANIGFADGAGVATGRPESVVNAGGVDCQRDGAELSTSAIVSVISTCAEAQTSDSAGSPGVQPHQRDGRPEQLPVQEVGGMGSSRRDDSAGNLERALATLRAQMEEAT